MVEEKMRRSAKEGIGFGIVAGLVFALADVVVTAMMGQSPFMPFRMIASVVLGRAAMETVPLGTAVAVGTVVHVVLSGLFGLVYGIINSRLSSETQTSWARQAGAGLLFGLALWLVNFQVIARILYPWFLSAPQFQQAVLHALFYGLPLGLMYVAAERRARHIRRAPTPA